MLATVLRTATLGALGATYLWMAHQAATAPHPDARVVLVGFIPVALLLITRSWSSRARWPILLGLAALFALLYQFSAALISQIVWIYFLQDIAFNLIACSIFAVSLRPSAEALCTQLARRVRRYMTPAIERYTRQITYAWALFFGLYALISAILFLSGYVAAWSWFANILNLPLVGVMFVVEYLVRLWVIPKADQSSLADAIRGAAAFRTPSKPASEAPAPPLNP